MSTERMRELKDIIKLSGIKLDEEWANTPESTNHPDQEEMGDLRDWGTNVELSLRRYLNHSLASPEFPQPITEDEMTASYKAFISEVKEEIVEKTDAEIEAEKKALEAELEAEKAKVKTLKGATTVHEDAEKVTEAQSEAQKAAFEKMLAAKNGNKDDTVAHEQQHSDDTIEGKDKEEDKEEKVEETADPYSGLYRMLTLAGLNPQVAEAEESDEEVVEEAEESEEESKKK